MCMMELDTRPPLLRPDLLIRPVGGEGRHVVKDLRSGVFFNLGRRSRSCSYASTGESSVGAICAAYEARFDEPLGEEDFADFLDLARGKRLLRDDARDVVDSHVDDELLQALRAWPIPGSAPNPRLLSTSQKRRIAPLVTYCSGGSACTTRVALRPIEPKLGFLWTAGLPGGFGRLDPVGGAAGVGGAGRVRQSVRGGWGWQTVVLAWAALAVTTACHECAHGLTCKRFGGEVRDMGFC